MPVALTIAGSDSSGGAGLQADLKTFEAHGVFGASAITLVTAQNTVGVTALEVLSPSLVVAQIRAVLDDVAVSAIKLGALGRADVMRAVADVLSDVRHLPIVLDPVMVSKHGHVLLDAEAAEALERWILPLATVATPNLHEAAALTRTRVTNLDEATVAAESLLRRGAQAIVVTGCTQPGVRTVTDVVATHTQRRFLESPRADNNNLHGSGCTFAAAITAQLALGASLDDAIDAAHTYTARAITCAPHIGHGIGPLGHRAAAQSATSEKR